MIKCYSYCSVLITGSVEVGLNIEMTFHQKMMEIISYDNVLMQNGPTSEPLFKTCVPITETAKPFLHNKGDQVTQILNINHTNCSSQPLKNHQTHQASYLQNVKFSPLENSYHPILCYKNNSLLSSNNPPTPHPKLIH